MASSFMELKVSLNGLVNISTTLKEDSLSLRSRVLLAELIAELDAAGQLTWSENQDGLTATEGISTGQQNAKPG